MKKAKVKANEHDLVLWVLVILFIFGPLLFSGYFKKLPQAPSLDDYSPITAFRN